MPRYVMDPATMQLVEIPADLPRPKRAFPMIQRDLPAYRSPCGTGWIEGRAARREDLKRNNCIEVAPGDMKPPPLIEPDWLPDYRASRGIERATLGKTPE